MDPQRLRIGLAGAGWVSTMHMRGWHACPDASVIAICDRDAGRARNAPGEPPSPGRRGEPASRDEPGGGAINRGVTG